MNKVTNSKLAKYAKVEHQFDFAKLYVFEDFFIGEIFDYADVNFEKSLEFLKTLDIYSKGKPEINYISNRVGSYSLELPAYNKIRPLIKKSVRIAYVSYSDLIKRQSEFERKFIKEENSKVVDSLTAAVDWITDKNYATAN